MARRLTVPPSEVVMEASIFIASMVATVAPASTSSPSETCRVTTPAKGAEHLHAEVTSVMDGTDQGRHPRAARLLEDWLVDEAGAMVAADPEAVPARRLIDLADGDPTLLRVDDLARRLSMSERSVQRLARTHVGMSPGALIRRRRLQEAAARVREDPGADVASIAADLGYSDHAHLTREFRRVLGFTPTGYRAECEVYPPIS